MLSTATLTYAITGADYAYMSCVNTWDSTTSAPVLAPEGTQTAATSNPSGGLSQTAGT